jgi:phosphoribosylformylglycinamidine cyclo-ligase
VIRRGSWNIPAVFEALRDAGRVEDAEMFRTFNMGIGYVAIVDRDAADRATDVLTRAGETVYALGEVVAGTRGVELAA